METFLKLSKRKRNEYLQRATARRPEINSFIMEKDFWVCWVLDQLYSIPELSSNITFKGGTSLSKCYGMIDRFSEDCDLTIEKSFINITEESHPKTASSNKQKEKRINELNKLTATTVKNTIMPLLLSAFENALSSNFSPKEWCLEPDKNDPQQETLLFCYPHSLNEMNYKEGYIQAAVKLEFGARGDRDPSELQIIEPYLLQTMPEVFTSEKTIHVNSLSPIRTFWEKATLLHGEHHRNISKKFNKRLFRHYYDIMQLHQHGITQKALQNTKLLTEVVENSQLFFRADWKRYDTAQIGTLKLYPNHHFLPALEEDYRLMSSMFFGETPPFKKVMNDIKNIGQTINTLHKFNF